MQSIILNAATRLLQPLLLVFAILVLMRGHNHPGGGFIAGLLAATALILYGFAHGMQQCWGRFLLRPHYWIALGLSLALLSAALGPFTGVPVMTGQWLFPFGLPLGSPLLFDVGVALTVMGVTAMLLLSVTARE